MTVSTRDAIRGDLTNNLASLRRAFENMQRISFQVTGEKITDSVLLCRDCSW
jgi:hypothetical protein